METTETREPCLTELLFLLVNSKGTGTQIQNELVGKPRRAVKEFPAEIQLIQNENMFLEITTTKPWFSWNEEHHLNLRTSGLLLFNAVFTDHCSEIRRKERHQ